MKSKLRAGFDYLIEIVDRDGNVRDTERVHNLMPGEGLNYVLGAALKGAAQITSFYVGLYEGNYTPVAGDTAATFPVSATERCVPFPRSLSSAPAGTLRRRNVRSSTNGPS